LTSLSGKHVLIIVQNLPVPFDTRVWQEANTLKEAGAQVSIICPAMTGFVKRHECLNSIKIYRHPLPVEADNFLGYLSEYTVALLCQFFLAWKIFLKKRFHVIQGCNPPDHIFLIALAFRAFGVKYIFDHHDISPELYSAKFQKKGLIYYFIRLFEKLSFKVANFSIATNESYREIAIKRGKMNANKVYVIRSGPDMNRINSKPANNYYKKRRKYLVGYVGVIGKQEGLHLLLESIEYIIKKRSDVQFAIVGSGTKLSEIIKLSSKLMLSNYVDFYGRVSDEILMDILSTTDLCVNPDEPNDLNQLSTMNKIMEYMALKKPIVQFDLKEGRVSAQKASLYARCHDIKDFSEKIIWLLDNEKERIEMGNYGYARIQEELSWKHQASKLVSLYTKALN
jgi:glycosyltransferase involved in cell wall biosynthesis